MSSTAHALDEDWIRGVFNQASQRHAPKIAKIFADSPWLDTTADLEPLQDLKVRCMLIVPRYLTLRVQVACGLLTCACHGR